MRPGGRIGEMNVHEPRSTLPHQAGMNPKIEVVAGARPNFMKVAPILRSARGRVGTRLVHTGQHYDAAMSDVFFEQLGIPAPDIHLGVGSGSHGEQTARVLAAYEKHLMGLETPPTGVVVVGDVNSTMACTLAATKLGIPVAHVEAGLRSFDRTMPEEINRIVTDGIADLLLVSEPSGVENLRREGVDEAKVRLVGNVMIDTLVESLEVARSLKMVERLGCTNPYVYVTLHRPSNVDDPVRLRQLVGQLTQIGQQAQVVFPVHPRTRARLEAAGLRGRLENAPGVLALEPLGYLESLCLMEGARAVITDSGGVQEETSYLRIPCLTVRPNTERPITVTEGSNTLVGDGPEDLLRATATVLRGDYKRGSPIPLWDGNAGSRIVAELERAWLNRLPGGS